MIIQERYTPVVMAANSTYVVPGQSIGGFICKTSGTLVVKNSAGVNLVDGVAVTAGVYLPLPIYIGSAGGSVVLSGGAEGTLVT
jgi:hypothetical protein